MSEEKTMILPRNWKFIHNDPSSWLKCRSDPSVNLKYYYKFVKEDLKKKRIAYLFKREEVIERCEYRFNSIICFNGKTNHRIRAFKVDYEIKEALYATFLYEGEIANYLVLVGDDCIGFHHIHHEVFNVIKVPFRVAKVFATGYGLLIERAKLLEELGVTDPSLSTCQIFSLSYPYSEVLPVLFKHKNDGNVSCAFANENISLLFASPEGIFLGFNARQNSHVVFNLRRATTAEREDGIKGLGTSASYNLSGMTKSGSSRGCFNKNPSPKVPNPVESPTSAVRRSLRNRAKMMANLDAMKNFEQNSPIPGGTASRATASKGFSGSIMKYSMYKTYGSLRYNPMIISPGDLKFNEVDTDLILVEAWAEHRSNIVSSTPVLNFSPLNNKIVPIIDDQTPIRFLNSPAKSVSFTNKTIIYEYDELPRKVPVYPVYMSFDDPTDIEFDTTNIENDLQCRIKSFNWDMFPRLQNDHFLMAIDLLIKKLRKEILATFMPHKINSKEKMKKMGVGLSTTEYVKLRKGWMKYYTRMMNQRFKKGHHKLVTFYSLLLYRREIWKIWRNHVHANVAVYLDRRTATRFFITRDKIGQKFIAFLVGNEKQLKLIKWDENKRMTVGATMVINAGDAVNIVGSEMMAVLAPGKENIMLYTGVKELGELITTCIDTHNHEILNFCESDEKSIIVRIQKRKRLIVKNIYFDLNFAVNDFIEKIYQEVFLTLPLDVAVKFYTNWLCITQKLPMFGSNIMKCGGEWLCDPLYRQQYEMALTINHFFESMQLKVHGLEFSDILIGISHIRKNRIESKKAKVPENVEYSSDDDEIMTTEVTVKSLDGKFDYLGSNAYKIFLLLHYGYESHKILAQHAFSPMLLEALYVFSKITCLDSYSNYYTSVNESFNQYSFTFDPLIIVPKLDDIDFPTNNVFTFDNFMKELTEGEQLPLVPKSLHWPAKIFFCAAMILNRITNTTQLKQLLGTSWQKRLHLADGREKDVINIFSTSKSSSNKILSCMRLLNLSVGDFMILGPRLSTVFNNNAQNWELLIEKRMAQKKLKNFPPVGEQRKWANYRWPGDIRMDNVHAMLDASRVLLIPVEKEDFDDEKQATDRCDLFLMMTFPRTVSKFFGKAVMGYRSSKASKVNFDSVPKIELGGKVPPNHAYNFPHNEFLQTQQEWTEFYSGVAHVLSLTDFDDDKITFNWLKQWHDETSTSRSVSSGCFFAYGLSGQFLDVNMFDIHNVMTESKRSMDLIAMLLGCAISFRTSCHLEMYRTVVTYLPLFIEPTSVELKFEPLVQVAAILSLGFLFQESSNAGLTNKLMNEMARETFFDNDPSTERYSYVLSAGIAIGLMNLGKGLAMRNAEIIIRNSGYNFEDRLLNFLNGASRILCTDFGRRNQKQCKVQRIGISAVGVAQSTMTSTCTGIDYTTIHGIGLTTENMGMNSPFHEMNRITANSATGVLAKESCQTKELPFVNIHLTSPAACIAIILMYLRTKDDFIISRLEIPNSIPLIEKIRPDVIMLRTIAILFVNFDDMPDDYDRLDDLVPEVIWKYIILIKEKKFDPRKHNVDPTTVVQTFFSIQAGIALALGIRYASSFHHRLCDILLKYGRELDPEFKETSTFLEYLEENSQQGFSAIFGVAMSLMMAGSGHLPTLRYLRKLKDYDFKFPSQEVDNYVFPVHAFANMGLGFLFMGNGRYGFSRTNEAVAMLIISLFPIFPHNISDNRCYFQPLRTLWCLSTEFRHLCPVDEEKHSFIKMQATAITKLGEELHFPLPGILPPLTDITTITLKSRTVNTITIDLTDPKQKAKLLRIFRDYHGRMPVTCIPDPVQKSFNQIPKFDDAYMDYLDNLEYEEDESFDPPSNLTDFFDSCNI
uniref:Anaphase-promoting complex subunit 1 n=1 Tax=Panagrolaimus sp. JU765 TaxID=591449 RepID=A0AC34RAV0_9BILA